MLLRLYCTSICLPGHNDDGKEKDVTTCTVAWPGRFSLAIGSILWSCMLILSNYLFTFSFCAVLPHNHHTARAQLPNGWRVSLCLYCLHRISKTISEVYGMWYYVNIIIALIVAVAMVGKQIFQNGLAECVYRIWKVDNILINIYSRGAYKDT